MSLGIFPALGSALNFGGRRIETIARVAWLPVTLLLVVNMATVFAYLSVIAGRAITFAEAQTFLNAERLLSQHAARGWDSSPEAMWAITIGNLVVVTILIASFMAPLIRMAGLGERPAPGLIRVPFGPDQLRFIISGIFSFLFIGIFILAPMIIATKYSLDYIFDAMSLTMANFPNPESLHTIELATRAETLKEQGAQWVFSLAAPLALVLPFALLFWAIVYFHFHPRNRPHAGSRGNPFLRALVILPVAGVLAGGGYLLLNEFVGEALKSITKQSGGLIDFSGGPDMTVLFFAIIAFLLVVYFNIRLFPYPGVAVCRRSLGLGNTMAVSRGWNFIRMIFILLLLLIFLGLVQYIVNSFALTWILQTMQLLYSAVATSTRLINSGETAAWVTPLFVWIWNGVKIIFNLLLTFFTYGALAGLYGRLYRDSEAAQS